MGKRNPIDLRYISRTKFDNGWRVCIPTPRAMRGHFGRCTLEEYVYDSYHGDEAKELSLAYAKRVRDRFREQMNIELPMDRRDGNVRSQTVTGVVGVSYLWRDDEIVGFRSAFRDMPVVTFHFEAMSVEMAWWQAVVLRYHREGKKDLTVPPLPNMDFAVKLNRGAHSG